VSAWGEFAEPALWPQADAELPVGEPSEECPAPPERPEAEPC
jgi:hypothetical protein